MKIALNKQGSVGIKYGLALRNFGCDVTRGIYTYHYNISEHLHIYNSEYQMADTKSKQTTSWTDLPPELWDSITQHIESASSLASLSRTNKALHAFVEKDAWKSFTRLHFPTTHPTDAGSETNPKEIVRTLTTLSRAWDRRAFIAQFVEPRGDITVFPGRKSVDRWKRPRGQTIGFTPQLDVYEDIGSSWRDRREFLAFSAGAEVCLRHTDRSKEGEHVRWTTYRPLSAHEGRDDTTSLHLLRPHAWDSGERQGVITGTANGDLQLLGLPLDDPYDQDVRTTYFATQGLPVRSSSLLQERFKPTLLATNLGEARVALYQVDPEQPKIVPFSQFDLKPVLRPDGNPAQNHRAWSTNFLSYSKLAVGTGPSEEPIHIYPITEDGLVRDSVRKIGLQNEADRLESKQLTSAVYTAVPLPSANGSSGNGDVFLSGSYDGIVRLHDLRSRRDVEQRYVDAADDSAIYSILLRGREKLMAGTSRHNLLKVFDLRLGAKCYNYTEAGQLLQKEESVDPESDYNIFLRANSQPFTSRGNGYNRNRTNDSSIYSLSSPSPGSPYVYAGLESAIMSLAFTEMLDSYPDPVFFEPWSTKGERNGTITTRTFESKDVLALAMYDQGANMRLCIQRSPWEVWRASNGKRFAAKLDERWKGANEFGP